jgi:hypothetical protein
VIDLHLLAKIIENCLALILTQIANLYALAMFDCPAST